MSKPWLEIQCSPCNGKGYIFGIGQRHVDCADCHGDGTARILPSELKRFEKRFLGDYLLYLLWLNPANKKRKGHRRSRDVSLIRARCDGVTSVFPHGEMLMVGFSDQDLAHLSDWDAALIDAHQ